jgi:2-oxoglutarate ferredoxin oxidoreductase subunit gamma
MAKQMQAPSLANMVLLGAIVAKTGCVKCQTLSEALKETISARKANLLDLNIKAVEAGIEFMKG